MRQTAINQASKRRTDYVHVKSLMERIILQSMEDLWLSGEKDDCINFFRGEGFAICAYIAGLKTYDKARFVDLANKIFDFQTARGKNRKKNQKKKKTLTSEDLSLWNMNILKTSKQKNSIEACSK